MICGSLFSGVGLLDLGLTLAGIEHAWFAEADPWRRGILKQRWPGARVLDDVRHVGHGCEPVDLIAGGFPCKGASTAGLRNGFDHSETVLWREMARAVGELRPRYVLVENVANLLALHDGAVWGEVVGTLAALGYDTVWDCVPAGAVGAPHLRDRVFAVARRADEAPGAFESAVRGGVDRRPAHVAPDANGAGRQKRGGQVAGAPQRPAAERNGALAPDANGDGVREQSEPEPGRGGQAVVGWHDTAPADTARDAEGGPGSQAGSVGERAGFRAGVAVEWGEYEPAIRRWENIHGPAPEPLVRRVDDRGAARVERSRLSALGDGVQVQVGFIVGRYLLELAGE